MYSLLLLTDDRLPLILAAIEPHQVLIYFLCTLMPAFVGTIGHLTVSAFALIFRVSMMSSAL